MKKKYYLLITAVILIAVSIVGSSLAAVSATGKTEESYLIAPNLELNLSKGTPSAEADSPLKAREGVLMPGDEMGKVTFYVENNGAIPFYVKVMVSHYWTENGKKAEGHTTDGLEMEAGEGWIKLEAPLVGSAKESETFYYAMPLQPGDKIPLDASVFIGSVMGNDFQGRTIDVTAKATAVQYVSGENELNAEGILNTFGVVASLDGSGYILSVTE